MSPSRGSEGSQCLHIQQDVQDDDEAISTLRNATSQKTRILSSTAVKTPNVTRFKAISAVTRKLMLLRARTCADGKRHLAVHRLYGSLEQRYRTSQKYFVNSLTVNLYLLLVTAVRPLSRSSSDPLTLVTGQCSFCQPTLHHPRTHSNTRNKETDGQRKCWITALHLFNLHYSYNKVHIHFCHSILNMSELPPYTKFVRSTHDRQCNEWGH